GILTNEDAQMIILDTPGLLQPKYALQRAMRAAALQALADADVVIYLADATGGPPPSLREAASLESEPRAPVLTVLNKVDAVPEAQHATLLQLAGPNAFLVSAETGQGVPELMRRVREQLPESPFLYPPDE